MPRTESKHVARVFDPDKEPSLKDAFRQLNVAALVSARKRYALVSTPAGTFCVSEDGGGPWRPIDRLGVPISFYPPDDGHPAATLTYTLADCEACLTGESRRLDEFIAAGDRGDSKLDAWERKLS